MSQQTAVRTTLLALVASDMAYAAGQPFAGPAQPLQYYNDTPPNNYTPPFTIEPGFVVKQFFVDDPSGFKAVLFERASTSEAILAFAGTDGLNAKDWAANSLHLGWNQWGRNGGTVLGALRLLPPEYTIHFTGQSLGGALAEYAAFDWITNGGRDAPSLTKQQLSTVTTFNGLGGSEALSANRASQYSPSVLHNVSEQAAYITRNDIVSLLGGGQAGLDVYRLDHRSTRRRPDAFPDPMSSFWDLDPIDAHRIETGYYNTLMQSNVFGHARLDPDYAPLPMTQTQRAMRLWGALANKNGAYDKSALTRIPAGLIAGLTFGSQEEITAFAKVLFRSAESSGAVGPERSLSRADVVAPLISPSFGIMRMMMPEGNWAAERKALFAFLDSVPWGTVLQGLFGGRGPDTLGLYASFIAASFGLENSYDAKVQAAFAEVAEIPGVGVRRPLFWESHLQLGRALIEHLAPTTDRQRRIYRSGLVGTETFAGAVLDNPDTPYQSLAATLLGARAAQVGGIGTDAAKADSIGEYAADLVSELADMQDEAARVDQPAGARVNAALDDFVHNDLGAAIAARGDTLPGPTLLRASAFGSGRLSVAEYRTIRDGFYRVAQRPEYAQAQDQLAELLEAIDRGGEVVALRDEKDRPFHTDPLFDPDAVDTAVVAEGQVKAFTVSLPYEATSGGQLIQLAFTGANLAQLSIAWDGNPVVLDANGLCTVEVPEGRDMATCAIGVVGDIDSDSTLAVSAQLLDQNGVPSHHRHTELSLTLDATLEAASNPSTGSIGTAQDDNRGGDPAHRALFGSAGADRLQSLAGRDELFGNEGDDLLEAGPGADMASGDAGSDRVFADTVLNEAQLRAYIASTATLVDNTDAPAIHTIESGDWLVGGLGEDTVVGSVTPDVLFGGGGHDVIAGGAGHDIIVGDDEYLPGVRDSQPHLTGITVTRNYKGHPHELWFSEVSAPNTSDLVGAADEIHAGAGDDIVCAQYGDDTVYADHGDDAALGGVGNDSLFGGAGNDRIAGDWYGTTDQLEPGGDDYLDGGDGDDRLNGEVGADVLVGGAGNDSLYGFIDVTFVNAPNDDPADDGDDQLLGGAGSDFLVGASGRDMLVGGDDGDQLFGDSDQTPLALQGDDHLDGGDGNDYLRGYGGSDELLGGGGSDTIHGEAGGDRIEGGDGDDFLYGMEDRDVVDAGSGKDQILGGTGDDLLDGGAGVDFIWGEAGDDDIRTGDGGAPGEGSDYVDGGDGNDTIVGGAGGAFLYGMAGNDTVQGGSDPDQVVGGSGADLLRGGGREDTLFGEADADSLDGEDGDDQLVGGDGNDTLNGGAGADVLFGEAGDDLLTGGEGRDVLVGGAGNDVYVVGDGGGEDVIVDDEGTNTLRFAEGALADGLRIRRGVDGAGNDRYLVFEDGGTLARTVVRGGIDGTVARFEFADGSVMTHSQVMAELAAQALPLAKPVAPTRPVTITGGSTNERFRGLTSDDVVYAGAGDDVVEGREGRDTLRGEGGADRLDGGPGDDRLIGGTGTDTYVFSRTSGRDVIEEQLLSTNNASELDTLEFDASVTPADVTLHRDGDDLVVAVAQTDAQVRVRGHFVSQVGASNADQRIEAIRFASGIVWDAAAIASRTVAGTPDSMTGTAGNDTFTVDHAGDTVNEAAAAGDDLVRASVSYALRRNVERLTLTGFVDTNAWSTPGNATSYLTGNAGNNVFNGPGTYYNADGTTSTTATGGGIMGYAVMSGGAGDDTYHLSVNVGGQVIEAPGEGYDTVVLQDLGWSYYALPANVEALRSNEGTLVTVGTTRQRIGNALDNTIEGAQAAQSNPSAPVNYIDGGAGADTMIGSRGNDVFVVDNVNDRIVDAGVYADGSEQSKGDEALASVSYELPDHVEVLRLTGAAAVDGYGNDLANTLDGTQNPTVNKLEGGDGDDLYRVHATDIVIERAGAGIDTIEWVGTGTRTYTPADLPDNVEGLQLSADAAASGYDGDGRDDIATGNASGNRLSGAAGSDLLDGGAGDDTLDGGTGDDWLIGGQGADVYEFTRGFGRDVVVDDGRDEIRFDTTVTLADVEFTTSELRIAGSSDAIVFGAVASIGLRFGDGTTLTGAEVRARMDASDSTTPSTGSDMLTGTPGADGIDGLAGDDFIDGRAGDDTLAGGSENDEVRGGDGNDTLRGDAGNDRLYGDAGNDRVEGGAGTDTLYGGANDDLLDGGAGDDTLRGESGDDRLQAGGGTDTLYGGDGNDTLESGSSVATSFGEAGDDTLVGGDTLDTLSGGDGNDRLQGGASTDFLDGGPGIDTFVLQAGGGYDYVDDARGELTIVDVDASLAPGDVALTRVVDEYLGNSVLVSANGGADTLELRLFGGTTDPLEIRFSDGTVWTPAMVSDRLARIDGTDLDDALTGTTADDRLYGFAGNDTLRGLAGNDLLDGGIGSDAMDGGEGDDRYVVDSLSDTVTELAYEGVDTVESSVSHTLSVNVENLVLQGTATAGTGNNENNAITGNALANLLDGKLGLDTLTGGAGNDSYTVDNTFDLVVENASEGTDSVSSSATFTLAANVENLTLIGAAAISGTGNVAANTLRGNGAANTLTGLAGDDTLDGGGGADQLRGGTGNDTYIVDHVSDAITELAGEGTDSVSASISYTLAAQLETLVLTGASAINGTGNTLANTLVGNAASNTLDGKTGNDVMRAGAGNDTYVVDASGDVVTENVAEGTDLVNASISYTLGANLENVTLSGVSALNATGNALANVLQGNAAANVLDGSAGADTLRGGAGNDTLVVDNAADVVVENVSEGDDTVRSYLAWTLGANTENLVLASAAAMNGTGNALDNWLIGNSATNVLSGLDGQDLVFGDLGNDTLAGGNGRDILQGGDGADTIGDTAGNNLMNGGLGADALTGAAGNEFFAGGSGNDTIVTGAGADIIAFNRGHGQDVVGASTGSDNTLSLGGGIRYADIALAKSGNDLVVDVGSSEQLTFKDWYVSSTNRSVATMQVVVDASTDWNAASSNGLVNKRVARFDFAGLVARFDAARSADPLLTRWSASSSLVDFHLGGSDTAALGGDIGYQYGRAGALTGLSWAPIDGVLASASFGSALQTLQSSATLFAGGKTLQ